MTQTKCLRCEGDAQQFLCRACTRRTRQTLRGLPRLMRHLTEAAVGQTRLGDIGRHTPYRSRHELDGESELASHIEPLPPRDAFGNPQRAEDDQEAPADLYESRLARETAALRKLLAAGGVNERASTLHDEVLNMLTTWIRDVCETRGVEPSIERPTAAGLCGWLAEHIDTIANHPNAEEFCDELDDRVRQALRIINRPRTHVYCGLCPAELTDNYGMRICNRELFARRGDSEIRCPACKTTHNVEELYARQLETVDSKSFTIAELSDTILPLVIREDIPLRKLLHWAAAGTLVPTGYDGDGNPRFLLSDVRKLRDGKSCSVEGCERKHYANDLCNTHYQRERRASSV